MIMCLNEEKEHSLVDLVGQERLLDTTYHNYNWVKKLKLKINYSNDGNKKLFLIEEDLYNPQNTITDSEKYIMFNHIYQHYIFHIVKDIDDCPICMNVNI